MSPSPEPAVTKRGISIGAIVLGYFTFAGLVVLLNVLAFAAPLGRTHLSAVSYSYSLAAGAIAAVVAGYVAGVSARHDEGRHGAILSVVLALAALASFSSAGAKDWRSWIGLAVIPLGAAAGGVVRARQQSRRRARNAAPCDS